MKLKLTGALIAPFDFFYLAGIQNYGGDCLKLYIKLCTFFNHNGKLVNIRLDDDNKLMLLANVF